jgi:hypothetical protein
MKSLFFLLFFTTLSFSWTYDSTAYTYFVDDTKHCIHDILWTSETEFDYFYNDESDSRHGTADALDEIGAENSYYYDNACQVEPSPSSISDSVALGLSESDYTYFMALSGNLVGFTLMFMVSLMASIVGRK